MRNVLTPSQVLLIAGSAGVSRNAVVRWINRGPTRAATRQVVVAAIRKHRLGDPEALRVPLPAPVAGTEEDAAKRAG